MKTEKEIKKEITRIQTYREKWPCSPHIQRECDLLVEQLLWVLGEDTGVPEEA